MDLKTVISNGCARDWETVDAKDAKPIRFAVIGLGWFTRGRALPALEKSSRCEPTVLVSGTSEKAARIAAETSGTVNGISYEEFHDGKSRDQYDAVYICTPNALHLEYAETAVSFGKDVLCEKPIERSSDRARELIETCEAGGVKLMVAYRMHTEPAIRRARELISDGFIGKPMEVRGNMSQQLLDRVNPNPDQWRLDEDLAGGGALFDLGIYPLNTTRFLLDEDPVAVTGRITSTHAAFDDVDETVSFTVEFPDEVFASCYASHNARQSSGITVTGTEGQVRVDPAFFQDQVRQLHISRGDGRSSIELTKVDQMLEEFDYFADRVRGDASIHPDGEHTLIDMRTMEAVYESETDRAWIAIE